MTRPNLVFLSSDTPLTERLSHALPGCAVMALDPRQEESDAAIRRLSPQAIAIDAGAPAGASAVLEQIAKARAAFPSLPLVAIGDEMSAQLILAAFRAGVDDFIDRDASDAEIRACIMGRLREQSARNENVAALVSVISPAPCEEDADLAFNIAGLIAQARPDSRVLLLDLSLPVSPARIALGLDPHFTVAAAIRDMARLDRTFLESALARSTGGAYVLPLAVEEGETELPQLRELTMLVAMLRALFDTLVVHWGAFSRNGQEASSDHAFVCCNQRFSSVRNAKRVLEQMQDGARPPVLVVHQMDSGLVPAPLDVIEATGAVQHLVLRAGWGTLALAHNRGRPLALGEPSAYGDALRTRLMQDGLLPRAAADNPTLKLLNWLRR